MDKLDIKFVKTKEEKIITDADVSPEFLQEFVMPEAIQSEAVRQAQPRLNKAAKLPKQDMSSMTDDELLSFLDGKGVSNNETIYPGTQFSVQSELTRRAIQRASKPNIYTKISLALAILSLIISFASSWPNLKGYLSLLADSTPAVQVSSPAQPVGNAEGTTKSLIPTEQ